jgi:hypothetical protein
VLSHPYSIPYTNTVRVLRSTRALYTSIRMESARYCSWVHTVRVCATRVQYELQYMYSSMYSMYSFVLVRTVIACTRVLLYKYSTTCTSTVLCNHTVLYLQYLLLPFLFMQPLFTFCPSHVDHRSVVLEYLFRSAKQYSKLSTRVLSTRASKYTRPGVAKRVLYSSTRERVDVAGMETDVCRSGGLKMASLYNMYRRRWKKKNPLA